MVVLMGVLPKGPREIRSAVNAREQSVITPSPPARTPALKDTHMKFHNQVAVAIFAGEVQNAEKEHTSEQPMRPVMHRYGRKISYNRQKQLRTPRPEKT